MPDILGLGVDLVEISRIEAALARYGEAFSKKVFTPAERAYCSGRASAAASFAARWAAKEAAYKAYATGWPAGWMREVEVLRQASGKPELRLLGASARAQAPRGVKRIELALTHSRDLALAQVLLLG